MPNTRRQSDASLVRRSQQGDRRAFGALVGRYDARLRGLAYALLLDPPSMDAALSSAYLRAWRDVVRLTAKDDAGAWLYRVTYNACIDALRRDGTPAAAAATPPTRPGLRAGLASLSPSERVALVLVDREGFTPDAAARILGLPDIRPTAPPRLRPHQAHPPHPRAQAGPRPRRRQGRLPRPPGGHQARARRRAAHGRGHGARCPGGARARHPGRARARRAGRAGGAGAPGEPEPAELAKSAEPAPRAEPEAAELAEPAEPAAGAEAEPAEPMTEVAEPAEPAEPAARAEPEAAESPTAAAPEPAAGAEPESAELAEGARAGRRG